MAEVFYKPRSVVGAFRKQLSSFYSVFPLVVFIVLFEVSYVLDYLYQPSSFSFHVLGDLLGIPRAQYDLIQVFIFPVVHVADFLVFGAFIYAVSKLWKPFNLSVWNTLLCFMLVWNTIGLLGFVTESLAIWCGLSFLFALQPVYLVVWIGYLMLFFLQQTQITKVQSAAISIIAIIAVLSFRMTFLG